MAVHKEIVVVDAATGEVYTPQQKKTKRTEPFYMTNQADAIELAKLKLTAMEYRVLLYLQGIADYDNTAQAAQVFLAKELEATEATISVCLKRLVELGLIRRTDQHGRAAFIINKKVSTRGKAK